MQNKTKHKFYILVFFLGVMRNYQYTPVPKLPLNTLNDPNPIPGNWFSTKNNIYLLVKSYPRGTLSRWLCKQNVGDRIKISNPQGTFDSALLKGITEVYLFAGGTGITPILSLAVWLLQTNRLERLSQLLLNSRLLYL